jgi:hypothetical protein
MRTFNKKSNPKRRRTHKKLATKPGKKLGLRTRAKRVGTKKRLNLDNVNTRYISPAEIVIDPAVPAESGVSPSIDSRVSVSPPWSVASPETDVSVKTTMSVSEIVQPALLSPLSQSPGSPLTVGDLAVSQKSNATTIETR